MFGDLNHSSYYRANPYYQQGYMPDTAFKNRKMPSYMVEIPQGEQYFEPTNKKHFQRVGYYSTIAEEHIINPPPISSPVTQKTNFRNLNIDDIQGANTNTLISKAVKNRMKAKEYLQERDREKREEELRHKMRSIEQMEDEKRRMEALSKINRSKEPNYHQKMLKLKTQQSEKYSPDYKKQETSETKTDKQKPSPFQNYHQKHYDQYQMELERTEREIRKLQEQLRGKNPQEKNQENNNYNYLPNQKDYQNDPNNHEKAKVSMPDQYDQKQIQPYSNRGHQGPEYHYRLSQRDELPQPAQLDQNRYRKGLQNYRNYSLDIQPPNKFRSLTENKVTNGYQSLGLEPKQGEAQRGGGTPIYHQQNLVRPTRQQHRRINPTYLSYESASIGLAGRNIIGY